MVQSTVNDASLSMQVNLYISGRLLKVIDNFSMRYLLCRVYEKKKGRWVKLGQTERINGSHNPDFEQCVVVYYYFEEKQELRFEIIDEKF